jgi:O-antigen/teichoic acid export membrane protein
MGFGLRLIILILVIKEITVLFGYYWLGTGQMPRAGFSFKPGFLKPLLSFGGWLCLVRALGLLLLSLEPFFIGALVTVKAVTYYAVPYKVIGTMLMVPSSIIVVLFPAFILLNTMDADKLRKLFVYSLKYIAVILGLPALVFVIFSKDILVLWMGPDFEKSAMVMRFLAVGTLFGGITWVFGAFLTGTGHPKVPAILGLVQAPLYIFAIWLLIKNFGINGAAAGWAVQKCIGAFFFYAACWKLKLASWSWKINLIHNAKLLKAALAILLLLGVNLVLKRLLTESLVATAANASLMIVGYLVVVWNYVIDLEQKNAVIRKLNLAVLFCRNRVALSSVEHGRNEA